MATTIRCGKCRSIHSSVAEVKACYANFNRPPGWAEAKAASDEADRILSGQAQMSKWDNELPPANLDEQRSRGINRPKFTGNGKGSFAEVKALLAEVPDGYYATRRTGEDGKLRFYRVKRAPNGFVKVQQQSSDDLYPVATGALRKVAEAILADGIAKAGLAYAESVGRCYRCGRTLTDENNPFKAVGLGPDCGLK